MPCDRTEVKLGAPKVPFHCESMSRWLFRKDTFHCQGKRAHKEEIIIMQTSTVCSVSQLRHQIIWLSFILDALICVFFALTHLRSVEYPVSLTLTNPSGLGILQKTIHITGPFILL